MRVHVADLGGQNLAVFKRSHGHAVAAIAFFRGLRDVIRVARHSVAHDFGQNIRAAALREFERFQNQHAGTFTNHKAIAVCVERPAGALRLVIACRKRAHGRKSAHAHWRDSCFSAPGDHHFRIAPLDDLKSVANGMSGGRAGRGRC